MPNAGAYSMWLGETRWQMAPRASNHFRGIATSVSSTPEEATVEDYDAVYVPGGAWNPDQLRAKPNRVVLPSEISSDRQTLGRAVPRLAGFSKCEADQRPEGDGLLGNDGRPANAGATVLDQPVVVDGNVITSRFIYDIPQFVDAIVAQLI
jgi:protease I